MKPPFFARHLKQHHPIKNGILLLLINLLLMILFFVTSAIGLGIVLAYFTVKDSIPYPLMWPLMNTVIFTILSIVIWHRFGRAIAFEPLAKNTFITLIIGFIHLLVGASGSILIRLNWLPGAYDTSAISLDLALYVGGIAILTGWTVILITWQMRRKRHSSISTQSG